MMKYYWQRKGLSLPEIDRIRDAFSEDVDMTRRGPVYQYQGAWSDLDKFWHNVWMAPRSLSGFGIVFDPEAAVAATEMTIDLVHQIVAEQERVIELQMAMTVAIDEILNDLPMEAFGTLVAHLQYGYAAEGSQVGTSSSEDVQVENG